MTEQAQILPFSRSLACRLFEPGDDLTLPHIEVHCKSQRCLSCSSTHRWSEVYEATTKGKTRTLHACRSPSAIPIDYFIVAVELPQEPVCACHSCIGNFTRLTDSESRRRWNETLARKRAEEAASPSPKGEHTSPRTVTLDML